MAKLSVGSLALAGLTTIRSKFVLITHSLSAIYAAPTGSAVAESVGFVTRCAVIARASVHTGHAELVEWTLVVAFLADESRFTQTFT